MLIGQSITTLDNKKRITLPMKFRSFFADDSIVISRGFDNCLVIRSISQFNSWQEKLLSQSEANKEARILTRQLFSSSENLVIDSKNRINIPSMLLEITNITGKVVIIGLANKLEIWSFESWNKFNLETKDKLEDYASLLMEN